MFHKSHNWAEPVLWTGVVITLVFFGYSVIYLPYWWSLTLVAVLLALLMMLGYVKYTQVMALKRKFIIVQESFTTAMLVYFAFYYFSGKNQMPADNVLKGARQKIDDVYEASRYHLTMPLVVTALKTFAQIKSIKNVVKHEVKNFTSSDGFSVDNAQIIASEITNLFQKIKQLVGIVSEGMPSKKDFDAVMEENIDEMIEKGETAQSSVRQKGKAIEKTVKSGVKSTARTVKRATGKTVNSARKSTKRK